MHGWVAGREGGGFVGVGGQWLKVGIRQSLARVLGVYFRGKMKDFNEWARELANMVLVSLPGC